MNARNPLPLLLLLATDAMAGAPRSSGRPAAIPESPDRAPALERQLDAERAFWTDRITRESCPFADAAVVTTAAAPAPFLAAEEDDEDDDAPRLARSDCQSGRHR